MNAETELQQLHLVGPTIPSTLRAVAVEGEALRLELTSTTQSDLQYADLTTSTSSVKRLNQQTESMSFLPSNRSMSIIDPIASLERPSTTAILEVTSSGSLLNLKSDPVLEINGIYTGREEQTNPIWPFWSRKANQITGEEYEKLYKSISKGKEYLAYKDVTIDKEAKLRAVLFVPGDPDKTKKMCINNNSNRAINNNLVSTGGNGNGDSEEDESKNNIKLCVGEYLIDVNCKNLLPKYLNFMKGVVDSEDAPQLFIRTQPECNLSVHNNYNTSLVKILRTALVNITLDILEEMNEKHFQNFYDRFSKNLKQGILEDPDNFERLLKLLRYHTSACGDERVSLRDYLIRMKEGQDHIYYEIGESLESISNSKLVERKAKKGFEVIFMMDNPSLEMSVVRKLSESKPLGGKAMILVSENIIPAKKPVVVASAPVVDIIIDDEDSRPTSPEMKTSSDDEVPDWSEQLLMLQELRRQPTRQARPKSLKDRTAIVGRPPKPSTVVPPPPAKKGRPVTKIDDKMVDFEGERLTLKEFLRLPEVERDVIESVESAFFDARRNSLCFKVKWKYYPANHKDKYNNEWATNIHNFLGGLEAVDAYIKRIKIKQPKHSKTLKIISEWNKTKSEVRKEEEELIQRFSVQQNHSKGTESIDIEMAEPSEPIIISTPTPPEMPDSSSCSVKPVDQITRENTKLVDKNLPSSSSSLSSSSSKGKEKSPVPEDDDLFSIVVVRKESQKDKTKSSTLIEIDKPKDFEEEAIKDKSDSSSSTTTIRLDKETNTKQKPKPTYRSTGTCTDNELLMIKQFRNKAVQTDKPLISTRRVYLANAVRRAVATSTFKPMAPMIIKQEPVDPEFYNHENHQMLINPLPIAQPPPPIYERPRPIVSYRMHEEQQRVVVQQRQPQRPPKRQPQLPAWVNQGQVAQVAKGSRKVRRKNWRKRQNYWMNKRSTLTDEEYKLFRKQQKRRHKDNRRKAMLQKKVVVKMEK